MSKYPVRHYFLPLILMRNAFFYYCSLALLICVCLPVPSAQALDDDRKRSGSTAVDDPVQSGVIYVKFRQYIGVSSGAAKTGLGTVDARLQSIGATSMEAPFEFARTFTASKGNASSVLEGILRIRRVFFDKAITPQAAAALMSKDPAVEYAEPIYIRRTARATSGHQEPGVAALPMVTPNDPLFAEQTHLELIQAPEAWDIVKGEAGNIVIGVVDGGMDWNHEDLRGNIWSNPGETPDNGIDDDGNGFIDDVRGWNFTLNSADPTGAPATPTNAAHGTQTSSMFGSVTDNNVGLAGIGWNLEVMPVTIGCEDTDNALCFIQEGMLYAIVNGATVINASFGGSGFSRSDDEVVQFAREMDVLIVASAGNSNGDNDLAPQYPANYEGVLSVGSTQKDDDFIGAFSNIGLSVDVFAPGVFVNAADPDNGYSDNNNGTSFSAPLVAGLAGLVRTLNPDWTYDMVAEQIRVTAEDMTAKNNSARTRDKLGKGRVNALRALTVNNLPSLRMVDMAFDDEDGNGFLGIREPFDLTLSYFNHLADANNVQVTLRSDDPFIAINQPTSAIGQIASRATGDATFGITVNTNQEDYEVVLIAEVVTDEYTDKERVKFIVNRVTHDAVGFRFGLPPAGHIGVSGFAEDTLKAGFLFPILGTDESFARNVLFEGGLMIGAGGVVSDAVRSGANDTPGTDFTWDATKPLGLIEVTDSRETGLSVFNDLQAPEPIGVKVHQETYTSTDPDFVGFTVLRYVITNFNEAETIEDLYAAMFLDWDILSSLADFYTPRPTFPADNVRFDTDRRMSYVYDLPSDAFIHVGSKLLTSDADLMYRSIDNPEEIYGGQSGDGFTEEEKWNWISGGIQRNNLNQTDLATMMGAGPVSLAPGESWEIAYSLFGGFSLEEIQDLADQSQIYWDEQLSQTEPSPVSTETPDEAGPSFALDPAFPNPFESETTIRFALPQVGDTRLEIYDVLGRKVRTLAQGVFAAGQHTVQFDGHSDTGAPLAGGVYLYRLVGMGDNGPMSIARQFVLVR